MYLGPVQIYFFLKIKHKVKKVKVLSNSMVLDLLANKVIGVMVEKWNLDPELYIKKYYIELPIKL